MGSQEKSGTESIRRYGKAISDVDMALVRLIARRTELVRGIWKLKGKNGYPLIDTEQERVVRERALRWARRYSLEQDVAEKVLSSIVEEGKRAVSKKRNVEKRGAHHHARPGQRARRGEP